jgi:cell division protein FtsL
MRRQNKKGNTNYLLMFLIILLLGLGVGQIYMSNRLAGWGRELSQIEQQAEQLRKENKRLRTKLITKGKLSELEEIAEEQGFKEAENIVHMKPEFPVALKSETN